MMRKTEIDRIHSEATGRLTSRGNVARVRPRFTLLTLIVVMALLAWLISLGQAGSIYVHFPIGLGVLSLWIALTAAMGLVRQSGRAKVRWRYWCLLIGSTSLLVVLLTFYPLFWSLALDRYTFEKFISNQRHYLVNDMPAKQVRDAGRRLFAELSTKAGGDRFLLPGSEAMPSQFGSLRPRYVCAQPEYLFVYLGKERDFYALRIYPAGANGSGRIRLAPGIWYTPGGKGRLITETEWEAGVRP